MVWSLSKLVKSILENNVVVFGPCQNVEMLKSEVNYVLMLLNMAELNIIQMSKKKEVDTIEDLLRTVIYLCLKDLPID